MPSEEEKIDRTIVVVGASGFKGAQIIKDLEADNRYTSLVAVDRTRPPYPTKKTRYYRLDLKETLADQQLAEILRRERCDTLVHTAFPITPPKDPSSSHELISVGTMYVLNAAASAGVRKVILASTCDVYGAFPTNPNFLEEDRHPPRGDRQSRFLADKIDAENQALRFARKYPDRIVTILRPASILGPSIHSYKTRLLRRFFVMTVMGFDPLLQCVHEDDLLRAFKIAIEKDCPGIYNIVGDGVLPLSRVIEICGKRNIRLPQMGFKSLIQMLWYLDLSPAPASHVDFLRYLFVASGKKAKEKMGFVPRFSTKEALLSFVGAERLRDINLINA